MDHTVHTVVTVGPRSNATGHQLLSVVELGVKPRVSLGLSKVGFQAEATDRLEQQTRAMHSLLPPRVERHGLAVVHIHSPAHENNAYLSEYANQPSRDQPPDRY
jgi:hypothetical protein